MRVVLFFIVLAGIALGVAYGYYNHLIEKGELDPNASFWDFLTGKARKRIKVVVKPKQETPPAEKKEKVEVTPESKPKVEPVRPAGESVRTPKPPEVAPRPRVDEALVGRLEQKVKKLYAQAKFLDAQFAAKELMGVFESANARNDPRYIWATRMFKRCHAFAILTSRIRRSPLATETEIYRIKSLKSGNVFYGRIIREYERDGEEFVDFERDAGITWRGVPKENLEITPATRQQFKEWLKERLAEKERFVSKKNDPAAVYIYLVTYAWRYGLDERVPELLETAFSQSGSEVVLDYVLADRDDVDQIKIDLLEGMGRDADAAKLRAVAVAPPTPEPPPTTESTPSTEQPPQQPSTPSPTTEPSSPPQPRPPEPIPPAPTSTPSQIAGLTGSALGRYREACRLRDEAVRLIGQAINQMAGPKRASLGKKAQALLRRAISIAVSLLNQFPNNTAVSSLQEELQGHIFFVNKNLVTLR